MEAKRDFQNDKQMKHEYGIIFTAELIIRNPDKWDNDTLKKFIDAANRSGLKSPTLSEGINAAQKQLSVK